MSRIARKPIVIPKGVDVQEQAGGLNFNGPLGKQQFKVNQHVETKVSDGTIIVTPRGKETKARRSMLGTACALIRNIMKGVSEGFERQLQLVGVGYRAKVSGNKLELSLGFSHPVVYDIPEGIKIEAPSNTELKIKGMDKQVVGQVAANIRKIRAPEVYKGKGVRYADEHIKLKETKKK